MLDKLTFTTADFQLSSSANIKIDRGQSTLGEIDHIEELCTTTEGDAIWGAKAFVNSEYYNVTITRQYEIEHNEKTKKNQVVNSYPVARVTCNPWRLCTGSNSVDVDSVDQLTDAIANIQADLTKLGVLISYSEVVGAVNRIDVACNLRTSQDEINYMKILEAVTRAGRLKTIDYGDTVYNRNGQTTFLAYSKRAEQAIKRQPIPEVPTLRLEYRKNTKRSVDTYYEVARMQDIDVKAVCSKAIYQMYEMIEQKTEPHVLSTDCVREILENQMTSGSRFWLSNALRDIGLALLIENYSVESIKSLLRSLDVSRERVSAVTRQLNYLQASNLVLERRDLHAELIELLTKTIERYKL